MRYYIYTVITIAFFVGCGDSTGSSVESKPLIGKAGSMARFAIKGDYLYTVNSQVMNILDISNASKPKKVSKIHIPFDVETLFAYKNNLYIGSNSGVYIYDNSTPTQPTRVSDFTHVQSCDPIVLADDVAFVTLNTDSNCWNGRAGVNRLEILDMTHPETPKFIRAIDMWEPKGLGVDKNNLFICDGENGLKVYDINKTDNNSTIDVNINLKENIDDIDCYDVITYKNTLIISNNQDIRQFDYSTFPMEELGQIK